MKLSKAIIHYLAYKQTHTKEGTVKTYSQQLSMFLEFLGDKEIEEIKIDDVVSYTAYLKSKYSIATVAFEMIILRGFFLYFKRQSIQVIDSSLIRVPRFIAKSHESLTYDEFQRLDSVYSDLTYEEAQRKLMIRLLYETGVRVSELCDLKLCDIDSNNPFTIIETKKSYDQRYIQWSPRTHQTLLKVIAVRIVNRGNFLFESNKGRLIPRTAQRWIKQACKLAGITRKISPHSFRHGKAHRMAELGADIIKIKTVLGHSNPVSSFKYLNFNKHEIRRMAEEFL